MKKMNLLCGILIGLMIFSSCSSDDDSNSEPSSPSLVGTWKQINQIDFCTTGSQDVYNLSSCEQTGRYTFNQNGNYNITFYELIGSDCVLESTENGTWEVNAGALNIINSDGAFQFTTFELSENALKLGADENSIDPDPCNDGFLASFTYDFVRVE
jgi:PBP1b-binding outer membrane lipoprotein LpoB